MDEVYYYERLRSGGTTTGNGAAIGWAVFAMVLTAVCWTLA